MTKRKITAKKTGKKTASAASKERQAKEISLNVTFKKLVILGALIILAINLLPETKDVQIADNSTDIASAPSATPTPLPQPSPVTQAVNSLQTDIIRKGDSYWRIAKRNCGSGKLFLAIQNLNNSKSLYEGENVNITCTLQ